jgi:DNA-binding CsgD family transcriptional regulator
MVSVEMIKEWEMIMNQNFDDKIHGLSERLAAWWAHEDISDISKKELPSYLINNDILNTLANTTNTVVQIYDMDGFKAVYTSPSCEIVSGFTPKELMDKGFLYWVSTLSWSQLLFYYRSSRFVINKLKSKDSDPKYFCNQIINLPFKNKAGESRKMISSNTCLEYTPEGKQKYQLILWQDMTAKSRSEDFISRYIFSKDLVYSYQSTISKFEQKDILSTRELEVIKLTQEGLTTKEIATKIFLSPYTVDNHKKNILNTLQVKNMSDVFYICNFLKMAL